MVSSQQIPCHVMFLSSRNKGRCQKELGLINLTTHLVLSLKDPCFHYISGNIRFKIDIFSQFRKQGMTLPCMDLNRDGVSEIFSRNLKEQQWTNNVVPTAKNSYNCYEASNYKDKLGFLH